ncbi:MAG: hypothetical protein QXJ74_01045 [Nitrososphaera sp.]|uniref:hypothetical protein n=1 Tax=Nitrososphaera sp. TaxID=1971748 RepID=UPI0017953A47|nr:hypothetical protein [Nitrososphaera sp.]NWG37773.1 hypothetical protein [Nitrososphaera sp.]
MASENREDAGYCTRLERALREAMGVFGEDSVDAMIMALQNKYGLRIGKPPCSSIEEIESALSEITGTGADIIVSRMRAFLR